MDDQTQMKIYGNHDLPGATNERPLVTFALFAYNQEKYIREAIEGAFSQTYSPLEIILSDDCSSDQTFSIMQDMAAGYNGQHCVILRRNERNLGLARHLNEVLAKAHGEIVSWAAGDDIALPERTEKLCQPFINNPQVMGVHSATQEIDIQGSYIKIRRKDKEDIYSVQSLSRQPRSLTTQSHAFRKKVFDHFGPFRCDLTHEGYAMTFREAALGEILYLDEPLTKYRIGSGISTYNGQEVHKLKISEPIKISRWHYTTALQARDDIERCPDIFSESIRIYASKNVLFFLNLMSINSGKSWFLPLVYNMISRPFDMRSLRAVLRKFTPVRAYKWAKGANN